MVFLSRVVSGAGSYKRKQKFGSVFAPEGRLAIEIQSSFLSHFFFMNRTRCISDTLGVHVSERVLDCR